MKNNLKFGLIIFTIITVFACKSDTKTEILTSPSGNNIFKVDKKFCKEMNLPIIRFSLEYPTELKTDPPEKGHENPNYNAFFKWNENEVQTEGISLGFFKPSKSNYRGIIEKKLSEMIKADLLNIVVGAMQQIFEISNVKIGYSKFDNNEYFMLRANGSVSNPEPDAEFVGNYIIQTLILEPQGKNKNGLLVTFIANEESEIKSFEDFASKGYISTVWKTLKFE